MIDTLSEIDLGIRIEDHKGRYVLRPYITGNTFWAHQALMNVKKMCEDELPGRYDLEVIDISHQLEPAREGRALAVLHFLDRMIKLWVEEALVRDPPGMAPMLAFFAPLAQTCSPFCLGAWDAASAVPLALARVANERTAILLVPAGKLFPWEPANAKPTLPGWLVLTFSLKPDRTEPGETNSSCSWLVL